ncbi:LOW QUALITY PROTEIN: FAR11 Factor arrest protein 11 [Candida maltosa Xu316]
MQSDELISIDQLEDQIIDHPDASTKQDLNESLDETFQKKLNARAEQIRSSSNSNKQHVKDQNKDSNQDANSINYQFLITKSHLDYNHLDYGSLDQELSEWFTSIDLKVIGGLSVLSHVYESEKGDVNTAIERFSQNESVEDVTTTSLKTILYYKYATKKTREDQLQQIEMNNLVLIQKKVYEPLIRILQRFMTSQIEKIENDKQNSCLSSAVESEYFRILTLFYFLINVAILHPDKCYLFKKCLSKSDIMTSILEFIEHWKWYPNNSHRTRYLILIVNKLIFLELGDSDHLKKCDDFLVNLHKVKNKDAKIDSGNVLTCSPLDYFVFREDLLDKYPLYDKTELQPYDFESFKNALEDESSTESVESRSSTIEGKYRYFMAVHGGSNSLSNLIEPPKTNKSHSILGQLPTQTVHIATPVPSPKLMASDYMSGGEKIRKSYQVNQAMPMIYPNDGESALNVPFAMKEADEILKNAVYESYSTKRLWKEREMFMQQERGYVDTYKNKNKHPKDLNEFDYDFVGLKAKFSENLPEIESMERIETLYAKNLCRLHTLVEVLMETIKVNRLDYNFNFAELELNPETSILRNKAARNFHRNEETRKRVEMVLLSQLEINNVKEITLKATTSILIMLLKWFKISHVLKGFYFSSLLFDQQFFTISLDYLSRCFNNPNLQSATTEKRDELTEYEILINQNKLTNPKISIPKFEFFTNCLQLNTENTKYELINKSFISNLPEKLDSNNVNHVYISKFNGNFAFILTNILTITNKILIKNQSQRIFTLNDLKPSELYKMILINYDCEAFNKPILKALKKLIPYQGRKWKSANMDLISQIYLNLKLSMKDNWLSGKDLESDFNNSYDQEIALRGLLQFYNVRNYPDQMESIGYEVNRDLANVPQLSLSDSNEGAIVDNVIL